MLGCIVVCLPAVLVVTHGHATLQPLSYSAWSAVINRSGVNRIWVLLSLAASGPLLCLPFAWAWNRRADRLNREAALPPPELVAVPGVWPPPPMPSASSPTAPKL